MLKRSKYFIRLFHFNQDILEVLLKKIDPESKGKLLILICQELSVGNILKMNQRLKCMELLLSQRDININERDGEFFFNIGSLIQNI